MIITTKNLSFIVVVEEEAYQFEQAAAEAFHVDAALVEQRGVAGVVASRKPLFVGAAVVHYILHCLLEVEVDYLDFEGHDSCLVEALLVELLVEAHLVPVVQAEHN